MTNFVFQYEFLAITIENDVAHITLNNPRKTNAINEIMWGELKDCFDKLSTHNEVKVCILKSNSKHFSSGIDLNYIATIMKKTKTLPEKERSHALYQQIKKMQETMNAIESCRKPVIAAIHGLCVGGAVDLIAACDIRLATYTALFSIMETKLGIVADMGTLQRLPYIISDSHLKELSLTSDFFNGYKAKKIGLVNYNYLTKKMLHKAADKLAKKMAKLPSIAVEGTKETINQMKKQQIKNGLNQIATLNSTLLLSEETQSAIHEITQRIHAKN